MNQIVFDSTASSIVFGGEFDGLSVVMGADTLPVLPDEHANHSSLIVFASPLEKLSVRSERSMRISYQTLFVAPLDLSSFKTSKVSTDYCSEEPYAIPQSTWRAGLPDPVPGRVQTPTEHIIIHHAAGSNSETDYTSVVRNYYTLHTDINGWDDIGYNYLIAQNGDIYTGRDPLDAAEQDNVRGAHYCGNNTNTMGICMLGNYMEIEPTVEALSSLYDLLAWKSIKEEYDVFGEEVHASTGVLTPRITGHRHACSTSCPGDQLWALMAEVRDSVDYRLKLCEGWVPESDSSAVEDTTSENPDEFVYKLLFNPSHGVFYVETSSALDKVELFDLNGNLIYVDLGVVNSTIYSVRSNQRGIKVLRLTSGDEVFTELVFLN